MKPREDGMTQTVYEIMVSSFMQVYQLTKEEAEKKIADNFGENIRTGRGKNEKDA